MVRDGKEEVGSVSLDSHSVPLRNLNEVPIKIGQIEAIFRYPVKSMRGEPLDNAALGWHGLDGDRRLAFRRLDEHGGFPWLTASKLPDLILFTPQRREDGNGGALPTYVLTPEGEKLPLFGEALAAEVGRRYGAPVEMMQLKHGIFDDASVSVITSDTVREVCRLAGRGSSFEMKATTHGQAFS